MLDEILNRRAYVKDPEHRFFMALLLNVEGRERIFGLIRQRFPDADPLEKVLDWVFDLAQTRVVGIESTNALGIPGFGDVEMYALEHLLHAKSDEEIAAGFVSENAGSEPDLIGSAITKIRGSVLFRPLLT